MLNQLPRCPRSSYPNFKSKKFDYSRDSNLGAYYNAADRLHIEVLKFGRETIDAKIAEEIIDKIISTDSIHEMTVYADILWMRIILITHCWTYYRKKLLQQERKIGKN